jgi:hypothetical protein
MQCTISIQSLGDHTYAIWTAISNISVAETDNTSHTFNLTPGEEEYISYA